METPFSFQDTYETWEFAGYAGKGKNGKTRFGIKVAELMEKWKVSFPPIPWVFRFIPAGYLQQVPPIPGYGYGRPKRGRPIEDLAKNLSVYELSQVGMKNMEIARLVFGFTRFRESLDKETILVRINAIKKTGNNIISRAYPFPSST